MGRFILRRPADLILPPRVRFAKSASGDHDYALSTVAPMWMNGVGAEGTFQFWLRANPLAAWQTGTIAPYTAPVGGDEWWFSFNDWIWDWFNNSAFSNGSLGITFTDNGRLRLLVGDGAPAAARVGDVHAIQGGPRINDGGDHLVTLRFSNVNVTERLIALFAGATQVGTETSTAQTNMRGNYWSTWPGYPQPGMYLGAEKQAAAGSIHLPDYDGNIWGIRFYDRAKSDSEVEDDAAGAAMSSTGLVSHIPCDEGTGTTLNDVVGSSDFTLVNPDATVWS